MLVHNNEIGNAAARDNGKVFVIFTNLYFELNSKILQTTVGKNGFFGEKLFENLRFFILAKHLSPRIKAFIDLCVYAQTSFGFAQRTINAPASQFGFELNPNMRTYFSLNDYIEDHTVTRSLNLDDLSIIFKAFFTLQLTMLAAYLMFELILPALRKAAAATIKLIAGLHISKECE